MRIEPYHEDRMTLELLDRLNRDGETALVEAELIREYAEILALLPYDLQPVQPAAAVWRQVEARIADRELSAEAPAGPRSPTVVPFPDRADSDFEARPPAPTRARRPAPWVTLAMAATIALCFLGLGYFWAQARLQQTTIEELRDAQARSLQVSHHYDMVRRTARQYYPLQPVSLSPREKPFYGRVWVCGMHQQWLLNIEGLKPASAGHEYRFWFETEDGKVDGGRVEVNGGEAQLSASSMPLGTKGFSVTLEVEGGDHRKPQGKMLLKAQEARDIVLGIEDLGVDPKSLSM